MARRAKHTTFAVPLTPGDFAPEVLYLSKSTTVGDLDFVKAYQNIVEELPLDAVLVIDILKVDGDKTETTDWVTADSFDVVGVQDIIETLGVHVRVRAQSGGTAGDLELSTYWTLAGFDD